VTEWRYLAGGTVVHALDLAGDTAAACGVYTLPASDWRGTGSQREYETAELLRPCKRCSAKVGARQPVGAQYPVLRPPAFPLVEEKDPPTDTFAPHPFLPTREDPALTEVSGG